MSYPRDRLFFRIFPAFLAIIALCLVSFSWYVSKISREAYADWTRDELKRQCLSVERLLRDAIVTGDVARMEKLCADIGRATSTRVTVVDPNGKVLADSESDFARMENHKERVEFHQALLGRVGVHSRYSATLERDMLYVAVPSRDHRGVIVGAVRAALPVAAIEKTFHRGIARMVPGALLIALISAALSLIISRKFSQLVEALKRGAARFAKSDFSQKLRVEGPEEIRELAETLNAMADTLKRNFQEITDKHRRLDAILSGMREGVIAFDRNERTVGANPSAVALLGLSGECVGKTLEETLRDPRLREFALALLREQHDMEKELTFFNNGRRFLRARGAVLKNAENEISGALIVFHDITEIRELENMRRDFVANVSHEIRTPLTVIKGAVETLQDGALDNPADRARFIEVIGKHAERLGALIDDILNLARIEQSAEMKTIAFSHENAADAVATAIDLCREKAEARNIRLSSEISGDMAVDCDRELLERALVNLLDNAIKYSDAGDSVSLLAREEGTRLRFDVRDSGIGIPSEDIPRLFERFYRVDKARSRKMGGTGLGLAIVKHMVQAHGGETRVESELGVGSVFTIIIPKRQPAATAKNA